MSGTKKKGLSQLDIVDAIIALFSKNCYRVLSFFSIYSGNVEPHRSTVFFEQEPFPVRESSRDTARALGRIGTVEVGDMLVSYVAEPIVRQHQVGKTFAGIANEIDEQPVAETLIIGESRRNVPVDLALVFKQSQGNAMHRSVPPPLVKEAAGAIQVLEIVLVRLAAPEVHVPNLEIAPEVACTVPLSLDIMVWPSFAILHPLPGTVRMQILRMRSDELFGLRVERWDRLRSIVEVDRKAVGFIVILHPTKDIIVNVAEEVHLWLHAPVVSDVFESRMFVEHAAVPSTHLVIGYQRSVLDFLLLQYSRGFIK